MAANRSSAPAPQQKRLAAYLDWLAQAAGHADRMTPLHRYCTGLLLDGERKSVEPMAARLAPDQVQRVHESLHHFVAQSPWNDEDMLRQVRSYVVPAMQKTGPVTAWIVDETGFVKSGTHSAGVARQYCGRVGKKENCQIAVSLSVATQSSSLPIAWRLYLPENWAGDEERRRAAGVPAEVRFQTKPQIALGQIQQAVQEEVPQGIVLADSVYGVDREFRIGRTQIAVLAGSEIHDHGVGAGAAAVATPATAGEGAASDAVAAGPAAPAVHGGGIGAGVAASGVARAQLARGEQRKAAISLRRRVGASGLRRRPQDRCAAGAMVADRVAQGRTGADTILAGETTREDFAPTTGPDHQATLDD